MEVLFRPPMSPHDPEPSREELAQSLFAELVERSPGTSAAEVEELCARHPALAAELRGLHEMHGLLAGLGRSASAGLRRTGIGLGGSAELEAPRLEGFRALRLVGRGGMGEVWEAFDLTLGRPVALKLLAPGAARSPRDSERFRREAQAAARLIHPNVVALFSSGEHDGRPFLVQELIEGGRTLRDEIEELRRVGAVPEKYERKVAERFVALADALARAHEQGIVHRDVKPQNILLEADGRPKLADFGLAKTVGDASLSLTGEFVGTFMYASPEQVAAGKAEVGPASDVFSLGATLYECLTLERPFGGESFQSITREILHEDPVDPNAVRARIPRDLAVICLRALEKRPEARYASMAALRDDLARFLAGDAIVARPPSTARRMQRAVLRHPTVATAIFLSVAAFAVILFLLGRTEHARGELQIANVRLVDSNKALAAARTEAVIEAETSAEVVSFLSGLFRAGDPFLYGSGTPTLKDVVLEGAARLRSGKIEEPRVRVRLLSELGVLLSRLGHWDEATSMLEEADALWAELGAEQTAAAVETRLGLAIAYGDQGRTEKSRALLAPLVPRARAPSDLPDLTRHGILGAAGFAQSEAGDPAGGEVLLREATELGPSITNDPLAIRTARISLASCLLRQGRLDEAAQLIEPLCVEIEPMLSSGNPTALDAFSLRGKLRLDQGRLEEGLSDFENSLEVAEAKLGAEHPRSMNLRTNVTSCYIALRRWDEAEELLLHGIEISTEHLGERSKETLTAYGNLGTVMMATGRHAEAQELLRTTVELEVELHGEAHLRTALARTNLALCLYNLGRPAESVELQETALKAVSPDIAEYKNMERALEVYRSAAGRR